MDTSENQTMSNTEKNQNLSKNTILENEEHTLDGYLGVFKRQEDWAKNHPNERYITMAEALEMQIKKDREKIAKEQK